MTKKELFADGLLLLTALIWGSAFAVVKNTLDSFPRRRSSRCATRLRRC